MRKEIKEHCAFCFKALSVPVRAKIYNLIKKNKKMSVGEIVRNFKLTQPTISFHLKDMEEAGVLTSRKEGRNVHYSISSGCSCGCEGKSCVLR